MRLDGVITGFWTMPANIDERQALEPLVGKIKGLLLGDKGFQLRQEKHQELLNRNIQLFVPARKNMVTLMTKETENRFKNIRIKSENEK